MNTAKPSEIKPFGIRGAAGQKTSGKFSASILPENYIYISHLDENFQF